MSKSYTRLLLVIVILVLINIVSNRFSYRLDLTKDQRFTLSQGTKEVLESLEEPVTVKAYISEKINAEFDNHRREIINILEEYRELSEGNVEIDIISPNGDEELEQEAQMAGVPPQQTGSQGRDKLEVQLVYVGLVIEYGEQKDVIPSIPVGQSLEYPITKAIKKLAYTEKPKVGILQGHGEPGLAMMQQAAQEGGINYTFEEVTINDTSDVLSGLEALVILNPQDSISPYDIAAINKFYESGGKLFVGYSNSVFNNGQQQQSAPMVMSKDGSLETWLSTKGVDMDESLVIDANAGEVMVNQGFFQLPVRFHYFPLVGKFAKHPISQGLEVMLMQFVSPLTYSGSGIFTPLAMSSDLSGREQMPIMVNLQRQWSEGDFKENSLPVAGAIEEGSQRMVVVSSGDFMVNGQGQQAQRLNPDNVNFFVNSLDWLTDNTTLLELRNKGVSYKPIKQMEDSKKNMFKYLNFLLPLILIVLYGVLRFQSKKNKRLKWKS